MSTQGAYVVQRGTGGAVVAVACGGPIRIGGGAGLLAGHLGVERAARCHLISPSEAQSGLRAGQSMRGGPRFSVTRVASSVGGLRTTQRGG